MKQLKISLQMNDSIAAIMNAGATGKF